MVIATHAIAEPDTVVVMLGDTDVANTAMLAPRRLRNTTRRALVPRIEKNSVIWISSQLASDILRSDGRFCCHTGI
jgi:alpha-D-ribose 1-methylphosphonate 5-triphosphate synthase subunit PhnH